MVVIKMSALLCYPAYIASSLGRNSIDTLNHHHRRGASLKYINLEMRLYLACAIINQRPPPQRGAAPGRFALCTTVVTGFEWFFFRPTEPSSLSASEELFIFQQPASQPAVNKSWRTHADFPSNKGGWGFNFGYRAIVNLWSSECGLTECIA